MKKKDEIDRSGGTEYQRVDAEKIRRGGSGDRGSGKDAARMDRLQAMSTASIRKNLEDPLSDESQVAGVIGLDTGHHGSPLKKGKK